MSDAGAEKDDAAQWCNDLFRSLKEGRWEKVGQQKVYHPGQREQLQEQIQRKVEKRDNKRITDGSQLKEEIMRHLTASFPGRTPREIGEAYASGSIKIENIE